MMHYTDDPAADAAERDYDFEEWLKSRPICDWCGEHIVDDRYFKDGDGIFCGDCWFTHSNDVYMVLIEE